MARIGVKIGVEVPGNLELGLVWDLILARVSVGLRFRWGLGLVLGWLMFRIRFCLGLWLSFRLELGLRLGLGWVWGLGWAWNFGHG